METTQGGEPERLKGRLDIKKTTTSKPTRVTAGLPSLEVDITKTGRKETGAAREKVVA